MPCQGPSVEELQKTEIDRLTNLLCTVCEYISSNGEMWMYPNEVEKWWEQHKTRDAERKQRETEKKKRSEKKTVSIKKIKKVRSR